MADQRLRDQAPATAPPNGVRPDIIEAATRVFSARGYHAATMAEIAAEVGIQKPSLYHHVRKKEDLLFAIHEQLIDELTQETLAVISASLSPSEKLREVLHVTMRFVARHRDEVTVFLQERRAFSNDRWTELIVKRDYYEQLVSHVIEEGTASNIFTPVPAAIAARAVLGMANWGHTWFRPDGPLSADEVSEIFATIALEGLQVR